MILIANVLIIAQSSGYFDCFIRTYINIYMCPHIYCFFFLFSLPVIPLCVEDKKWKAKKRRNDWFFLLSYNIRLITYQQNSEGIFYRSFGILFFVCCCFFTIWTRYLPYHRRYSHQHKLYTEIHPYLFFPRKLNSFVWLY